MLRYSGAGNHHQRASCYHKDTSVQHSYIWSHTDRITEARKDVTKRELQQLTNNGNWKESLVKGIIKGSSSLSVNGKVGLRNITYGEVRGS